jgi:protein-tyrosine phosphatase
MAKGLLVSLLAERNLSDDIDVSTAGMYSGSGEPATTNAVKVMSEVGIDLTDHQAKIVTPALWENVDYIVTMTKDHSRRLAAAHPDIAEKIYTLYEFAGLEHRDVMDPFGGNENVYRACRDEIKSVLLQAIKYRNLF